MMPLYEPADFDRHFAHKLSNLSWFAATSTRYILNIESFNLFHRMATLIIPGYLGSGKGHWQTWMQDRIPGARRVEQDWDTPILANWALNIRRAIDEAGDPVWLIAHSFGCLASIAASSDRVSKVAGVMMVAPANPDLFTLGGFRRQESRPRSGSLYDLLPASELPFRSLIIASKDDPVLPYMKARILAAQWGSKLLTLESAGHINIASGFGPWPQGLDAFYQFQQSQACNPLPGTFRKKLGRSGCVARIRHLTRRHLGY